jgi:hypothetical protein
MIFGREVMTFKRTLMQYFQSHIFNHFKVVEVKLLVGGMIFSLVQQWLGVI